MTETGRILPGSLEAAGVTIVSLTMTVGAFKSARR